MMRATAGRQAQPCGHISGNMRTPIKHVLADGREIADIEGYVVPMSGQAAAVYQIAAEFARRVARGSVQDKDGAAPRDMEEEGWKIKVQ